MIINHNITALNTHRQLSSANSAQTSSMEKLSSGLRINSAKDDAAGLSISEKMRGQIRGLEQASKNAQDGISFLQTAEGALNETHDILQRMRELAVQSGNDTNTDTDRKELQKEADQLAEEITRISNNTEFNQKALLNGAVDDNGEKAAVFHIGANTGQQLSVSINAMDAKALGVSGDAVEAKTTTVGGKVDSVTYDNNNLGAKVVDNATISMTYTAATTTTPPVAAVPGEYTVTLSAAFVTGEKVTIDGEEFTAASGTSSATTFNNADAATQATTLANAINGNTALSAKYTATVDGNNVKLVQKAGAESPTNPTVSDNGGTANATVAEITPGVTGVPGGTANGAKVTISDGTTTQDVAITDTAATSLKITTGAFSGLKFDLGTNTIAGLATTGTADQVVVDVATVASTKATFVNGEKTADAKAAKGINISSQENANTAITKINDAIETVSAERSKLGAVQNRLDHTINNLGTTSENLTAAESRIRDVDMAKEMMEQTKNSILSQAAQAMLAQSNQMPQAVLQLLR
jgi:flagellin